MKKVTRNYGGAGDEELLLRDRRCLLQQLGVRYESKSTNKSDVGRRSYVCSSEKCESRRDIKAKRDEDSMQQREVRVEE